MDVSTAEPPASQRPESFHPDFQRDVQMVVISVGGQGFKTDAARLAQHSTFLRDMFFGEGPRIGVPGEGTEDHPIVLESCTAEEFANFLGWLDLKPWSPQTSNNVQQLLDILHISHMWDVAPGMEFASTHLLGKLTPAHRLELASRYGLWSWLSDAVRDLIALPLQDYTLADMNYLSYGMFSILAVAKEAITTERMRLGVCPPYPKDINDLPYCGQHHVCRRVWTDKWYGTILRQICTGPHASRVPISSLKIILENTDYTGMNSVCKAYLVNWIAESRHMRREEELTQVAINDIRAMFP